MVPINRGSPNGERPSQSLLVGPRSRGWRAPFLSSCSTPSTYNRPFKVVASIVHTTWCSELREGRGTLIVSSPPVCPARRKAVRIVYGYAGALLPTVGVRNK